MGIFEPFRALGYVTDSTPFCIQRRGIETFVTVSVGKAFQIYNCAKISLVFVGPQLEKKIRALASWRDFTYVAAGLDISVFKRAQPVATWSGHTGKVLLLLSFGDHVLSVGKDGQVLTWSAVGQDFCTAAKPVGEFQLRESFNPTCIMHPDTYLNKVLIGSEEGSLQLWNISSQKLIFEFKGWGSRVCCCVSSPALDVIGIGCGDGRIHLHNLRYDETVVSFTHTTRGAVTSLSFRSDGEPLLAAGGSSGVISVWNLEKRKLQAVIKDAHDAAISALHFISAEPVLLSAGADNALKMWIFDSSDGEAQLLRFRSGHSAPPSCIRYYGSGCNILSAGQDRSFRYFSTIQDQQSRELSQGHVAKRAKKLHRKEEELKLPPVVAFAAAEIRERDWCNVVTCHVDDTVAYSWRLQNFVIGEHLLKPFPDNPTPVKACAISACGNFAVLGTDAGCIERFNLQSGLSRGSYEDKAIGKSYGHAGAVVGLGCDSTNTFLISGGYDGNIKLWGFKGQDLKSTISVGSPLVKLVTHPVNGLVAVASDDNVLRLYDVLAVRLVRVFSGHTDRINDICFSEDGKWLLSSAMDRTVRVWDLVASKPLDTMEVDAAVTALSLSPTMDMLATAHVNQNGIFLWANRFIYSAVDGDVYGSGKEVVHVSMPSVSSHGGNGVEDISVAPFALASGDISVANVSKEDKIQDVTPILPNLITLSLLPVAQWQGLVNLELIKVRNKPEAPPKKPERAPFFLPSLLSLSGEPVFVIQSEENSGGIPNGKIGKRTPQTQKQVQGGFLQSSFIHSLHTSSETGNYGTLIALVKSMTPSALDAELRMLQIIDEDVNDGTRSTQLEEIGMVLDFLIHELSASDNFEFVQALIQLFLKIHGEIILRDCVLQEKVKTMHRIQCLSWQKLDSMFQRLRCTVAFLSNAQI